MKTKKILTVLLIYCLLIQSLIIETGCKTFYPAEGVNDLSRYQDYKNKILLKLTDNSYVRLSPQRFFYVDRPADLVFGSGNVINYKTKKMSEFTGIIEKNDIDSNLAVGNYQLYWTMDSDKYIFENKNVITVTPDSGNDFWIVKDDFTGKFRKIKNNEIKEIQLQQTNWVLTSALIVLGGGLVALIVFIAAASAFGSAFQGI